MQAHSITPQSKRPKKKKRVGRGSGSGKGTYSARGMKGQRARSGGAAGLKAWGFKQSLQKVPKLRGFQSPAAAVQTVTLAMIARNAGDGAILTPHTMKQLGIISNPRRPVKIVATGVLDKKVYIKQCVASKTAIQAIEAAGGTIAF